MVNSAKAVSLYQNAIQLAPRDLRLQVALGGLYEQMGNWQEAQSTYQKVLATEPQNALASNNLAYLLLEHGGSPTVALTLAQTGRKGPSKSPEFGRHAGMGLLQQWWLLRGGPAVRGCGEGQSRIIPTYRYHLGPHLSETAMTQSRQS